MAQTARRPHALYSLHADAARERKAAATSDTSKTHFDYAEMYHITAARLSERADKLEAEGMQLARTAAALRLRRRDDDADAAEAQSQRMLSGAPFARERAEHHHSLGLESHAAGHDHETVLAKAEGEAMAEPAAEAAGEPSGESSEEHAFH